MRLLRQGILLGKPPNGLPHALRHIFVVGFFEAFGPNGRTEANLELERCPSGQRLSDRLQHVQWSPVSYRACKTSSRLHGAAIAARKSVTAACRTARFQ